MNLQKKSKWSLKKFFLNLCVLAPFFMICLLILFIYLMYQGLYIIPLITDSYWFDQNPNKQLTQAKFPIFHQINLLQEQILVKASHYKGISLFIIEHYLLFWLLFSLIRTMRTNPGEIPGPNNEWSIKVSSIIDKYKKAEKKRLRKLKKLQNNPIIQLPTIFDDLTKEPFIDENQDQGRQGTYPNSKASSLSESEKGSYIISEEFTEQERILMCFRALEQAKKQDNLRFCQYCYNFKPLRTHHCQQCMRCVLKMDHHCQWLLNCVGFGNYKFFMNTLIYTDLLLFFLLFTFTNCVSDVALNPYIDGKIVFFLLFTYVLCCVILGLVLGFTVFHFWLIYKGKTSLEYLEGERKMKKRVETEEVLFNEGLKTNFIRVFNRNPLLWFLPFNRNEEGEGLFEKFH